MHKLLFLLSFIILACSSTYTEENPDRLKSPIIYGSLINHSDFPTLVAIMDENYKLNCTGSLLAPDLVITAAHCVPETGNKVFVVHGYEKPSMASRSEFYKALKVYQHPQYYIANDLALIVLEKEIILDEYVPILSDDTYDYLLFRDATIIGYGFYDFEPGHKGILHGGQSIITKIFEKELQIGTEGTVNACYGDSGGPAYIIMNDKLYLVGIASRLANLPECEAGTIYMLPGAYMDWINDVFYQAFLLKLDIQTNEKTQEPPTSNKILSPYPKKDEKENNYYPGGGCSINNNINCDFLFIILFLIILKLKA